MRYDRTVSEWDFYPATIDDRPASVSIDMYWVRAGPMVGADTHYIARVAMLDLGPHGMGTGVESEVMYAFEEELEKRLAVHEIVFVGRIRTHGVWQMSFYGPASARADFVVVAPERVATVEVVYDPAWHFYEQTLSPSLERRQWMLDRAVVEELERRNDPLVIPRKVEHWSYFKTSEARDAFIEAAAQDGFAHESGGSDESGSFVARVAREDTVELDAIHDAVMILVEHAVAHGGRYDGWECPVKADS
jgi:hypothetical protein